MITTTNTVYTLQQRLHVNGKQKPIELTTYFRARSLAELDQLLAFFANGRTDDRIVEQEVPNRVYESGFRVEWVSLTAPDNSCLNDRYSSYPWGGNHGQTN